MKGEVCLLSTILLVVFMFTTPSMAVMGTPSTPQTNVDISGKKVVFVIYNFEMEPWTFFKGPLESLGVTVDLASNSKRVIGFGVNLLHGGTVPDLMIDEINVEDYDGIVLAAGGPIAPMFAERDENLLQLLKEFDNQGKLVAAFCHNGPILEKAGLFKEGETPPPCPSPGTYRVHDNIVTGATPASWQDFTEAIIEILEEQEMQPEP